MERQKELIELQKTESKKRKEQKDYNMRLIELYGKAEEDIYDDITDKFNK